ncbi:hypothetical protein DLR11_03115 [Salmonella enterica subsp. salamae]|nr:hypothetical protein [Salmonella enterica subsp. salamae]ECI4075820.1 hypothetical protein [Salmonella enterica subsp. salamae]
MPLLCHKYRNRLNYLTLLLLSKRSNTSALSHNVTVAIKAKTGINFTIHTRFAALFTVSSRQIVGNAPYFGEISLKNAAVRHD